MKNSTRTILAITATIIILQLLPGCRKSDTPEESQTPEAQLVAKFLSANKLLGGVTLIEFGLIGCELSEQGLTEMTRLHRDNVIPGLSYIRVEEAGEITAAGGDGHVRRTSLATRGGGAQT